MPEYLEMLENIATTWRWTIDELKKAEETKIRGIGITPLIKEKVASIMEATVVKTLIQHWEEKVFNHWPVIGRVR